VKRLLFCLMMATTLLAGPSLAAEPPVETRLLLSNPTPYVGEEVTLTLEVRYARHPGGLLAIRWPRFESCVTEELPPLPPRREEGSQEPVVVEAARRLVRPVAAGRLLFEGGVDLRGRYLPAAPVTLRVRPLPAAGRPEGFAGAVGSVVLELQAAGVGTREVAVALRGNAPLDAFPPPLPALPRGERLVPLGDSLEGVAGGERTRTFRYLYLPGEGRRGELAFSLAVFDPAAASYRVLHASLDAPADTGRPGHWAAAGAALAAFALLWLRHRRRRPADLEQVLAGAMGRPTAGLPRETILEALRRRGATEASLAELVRFWEAGDRARFAPQPQEPPVTAARLAKKMAKEIDKSRCIP
jgi:hypothetical protein